MQQGLFSQAFFNMSIGLERLLKMIFLIDYGLRHDGRLPDNEQLKRRFRHDLVKLHDEARAVRSRLVEEGETFNWELPDVTLAHRIVRVLGEFAKSARYYNLDYLTGSATGRDPIRAWNDEVALYLMKGYPQRLRRRDEQWAETAEALIGDCTLLRQETEGGEPLGTVEQSVLHGRRGEWIQKQATFHFAALVRDLVEVLWELWKRSCPGRVVELPVLPEYFTIYYNDDSYLRRRRTFLD